MLEEQQPFPINCELPAASLEVFAAEPQYSAQAEEQTDVPDLEQIEDEEKLSLNTMRLAIAADLQRDSSASGGARLEGLSLRSSADRS